MESTIHAQYAIQACNVAGDFHPVEDISKLMPGWKIVWLSGPVTDPNFSYVAVNTKEDLYILATRGSVVTNDVFTKWDSFVDWILEDLNEPLVHWPYASTLKPCIGIGAYIGFSHMLHATNALEGSAGELLLDFLLTNTTGKGKHLIIAGHSLGGNLSNVYASFYVETLKEQQLPATNVSLFTFAAPASGNFDFVLDLEAKLLTAWHYQNTNDAVPNFPVYEGLLATGKLYGPNAPDAPEIIVPFDNKEIPLQEVYTLLADIFFLFGYHQPKRNYITFTADLNKNFLANTIGDWLAQAGSQHQLYNYAKELNVVLPPINSVKRVVSELV